MNHEGVSCQTTVVKEQKCHGPGHNNLIIWLTYLYLKIWPSTYFVCVCLTVLKYDHTSIFFDKAKRQRSRFQWHNFGTQHTPITRHSHTKFEFGICRSNSIGYGWTSAYWCSSKAKVKVTVTWIRYAVRTLYLHLKKGLVGLSVNLSIWKIWPGQVYILAKGCDQVTVTYAFRFCIENAWPGYISYTINLYMPNLLYGHV